MYLYHYYDKDFGPFKNLSDVSNEEVKDIVNKIAREKQSAFCNKRNPEYMLKRRYYENILREEFSKKRGRISDLQTGFRAVSGQYVNEAE